MSDTNAPLPWKYVAKTLLQFAPLWGGTVVLFTCFGLGYTVFRRDYWAAAQPLVLRSEATGSTDRLGRFSSQSELKAAQETILEMASNHDVVLTALEAIGPEDGQSDPHWPSSDYVSGVASNRIAVRPPEGSEFGDTEVIYLAVEATSPERAEQFCEALYASLSQRLRSVRQTRADSVMAELLQARDLARRNLDEAAHRLREIEVAFGSDLSDLRNLTETFGDGANRRSLDDTQRELQSAELELDRLESLYKVLVEGRDDPARLVVTGGELLSSQPSLLKMKDGMIEAQMQTSQLSGRYTAQHPRMRAAMETENEIRQQMRLEAAAVISAMQPSLQLGRQKVARLRSQLQQLNERLERVAGVRTQYAGLASEVNHRRELLEQAEKSLSEAQAIRDASAAVNLLAELGPPLVSDHPVGTSGSLATVASATAGLLFGLGAVFLVAPGPHQTDRGRRWSDLLGGRRATDSPSPASRAIISSAEPPGRIGKDLGCFPGDRRRNPRE